MKYKHMPNKKAPEPPKSPEELALVKRVESMMELKNSGHPSVENPNAKHDPKLPAIDIFKGLPLPPAAPSKTAPTVPKKLLKTIEKSAEPTAIEVKVTKKPTALSLPAAEEPSLEPEVIVDPPEENVAEAPAILPVTEIDDDEIDEAVDAIVANESDAVLAAEDAAAAARAGTAPKTSRPEPRLFAPFKNKWFWLSLGLIIVVIFGLPLTRYKILGLFIKEPLSVTVLDSKTTTPISGAIVSIGSATAKTDAAGHVSLKAALGDGTLRITKQYFVGYSSSLHIGFKAATLPDVSLIATGRLVPLSVVNSITGKPLANVQIAVLDTTAKTNSLGKAIIVLPTKTVSDSAKASLSGYNTAGVSVQVTANVVAANTIQLTPAGHVYFLSNQSGTIDVVKANLDGTGRQTVLAGTGDEDPRTTSLLASRDWKFLVLKAQRTTNGQSALYLIDTSDDKVTEFDSGDNDYNTIGWSGHDFLYDLVRDSVSASQSAHELVKSYDADNGQLNQLDENQAMGNASSYAYQGFSNFYILDNLLVYNTQWYSYSDSGTPYDLSAETDSIRGVEPEGQNKKDYQSVPAASVGYIEADLYKPQAIYYEVYNSDTDATTDYNFNNSSVSTLSNLPSATFDTSPPVYLISPSGDQTFWSEQRDAGNTLQTGDSNAGSPVQIAADSDYAPYGWYTDSYLLVSKNDNQLYIMPAGVLGSGQQPVKISDYYQAPQTFSTDGYGYGSGDE
jgi:hypothetical protein